MDYSFQGDRYFFTLIPDSLVKFFLRGNGGMFLPSGLLFGPSKRHACVCMALITGWQGDPGMLFFDALITECVVITELPLDSDCVVSDGHTYRKKKSSFLVII